METESSTGITYMDYQKFWNANLQKIEQLQQHVETSLNALEANYADFEHFYAGIMRQLDIFSSIYSGYNTLRGSEEVMRLKSLLESYRKRYTRESMDFNLINRLMIKICDERNLSFENFPVLSHADAPITADQAAAKGADYSLKKYRWITFERNRSWFIARYLNAYSITNDNFAVRPLEDPEYYAVDTGTGVLRVRDIFSGPRQNAHKPRFYIILDDGTRNYAAGSLGRRIFAEHDFVTPLVTPFRNVPWSSLSPGRVRLFGINHLVLY